MKAKFTQAHARNILPGSVRFTCRDGEYRLTFTSGAIKSMNGYGMPIREIYDAIESSAYYTCDLSDVVATGEKMHDEYCRAIYEIQKES